MSLEEDDWVRFVNFVIELTNDGDKEIAQWGLEGIVILNNKFSNDEYMEKLLENLRNSCTNALSSDVSAFPSGRVPSYDRLFPPKYWGYLVIDKFLSPFKAIEEFVEMVEALGHYSDKLEIQTPYRNSYEKTKKQVTELFQDQDGIRALEGTAVPYLLITDRVLYDFDPENDQYEIFTFPKALSDPVFYVDRMNEFESIFASNDDFFDWCDDKLNIQKTNRGIIDRIWDALELKPGFAGLTINLKTVLK